MKTLLNPSASLRTGCSFGSFFSIMSLSTKDFRDLQETFRKVSFFVGDIGGFSWLYRVFPSPFGIKSLTQNARFLAFQSFGSSPKTNLADRANRTLQPLPNSQLCNNYISAEKLWMEVLPWAECLNSVADF